MPRCSKIYCLLSFALLLLSFSGSSQDTTSVYTAATTDSLPETKIKRLPVPKKALMYSLILPGSGQIYNGRWWKAPFVYAAIGGVVYAIDYNQGLYRRLKTAYVKDLNGEEHEFTGRLNRQALKNARDSFDKNTQLSYIGLVIVYLLGAAESFVDAHLQNFDVDEDLSIRWQPTVQQIPGTGYSYAGLGVIIPIGANNFK